MNQPLLMYHNWLGTRMEPLLSINITGQNSLVLFLRDKRLTELNPYITSFFKIADGVKLSSNRSLMEKRKCSMCFLSNMFIGSPVPMICQKKFSLLDFLVTDSNTYLKKFESIVPKKSETQYVLILNLHLLLL